jgi:general secretion pathway protein H
LKPSSGRASSGFTLVELMVVVTIIGIMAAMMVVSGGLPDASRDLKHEADRMRAVFSMASEEAVIQQSEIGVELTESGYRFMRFERPPPPRPTMEGLTGMTDPGAMSMQSAMSPEAQAAMQPRWVLIENDDTFRTYLLPETIRMQVQVDYDRVDMQKGLDERSNIKVEQTLRPNLYFLSSGETSPFLVELFLISDAEKPLFVHADVLGRVEVLDAPPQQ